MPDMSPFASNEILLERREHDNHGGPQRDNKQ
jgi:hypothetical protein